MNLVSFSIGLIAVGIVVYNNIIQAYMSINTREDILAFVFIIGGVLGYYAMNIDELRRLFR